MKHRLSPTEKIESDKKPGFENKYIKYAGEELIPVAIFRQKTAVCLNPFKALYHRLRRPRDKIMELHTHPDRPIPSILDLDCFLMDKKVGTMAIATRDPSSGKVFGYTFVRKTQKMLTGPAFKDSFNEYERTVDRIYKSRDEVGEAEAEKEALRCFKDFIKKSKLQYRFVPVGGYSLSNEHARYVKKSDKN